jgi:hypothetical protein
VRFGRAGRLPSVCAASVCAASVGLVACSPQSSAPVATLPAAPGVVATVSPASVAAGQSVVLTLAGGEDRDVKGALVSLRRNDVVIAWLLEQRYGGPTMAKPGETVPAPNVAFRLSLPQTFVLPSGLRPGEYRLCTPVGPPGPVLAEACAALTVTA